VLSLVVGTALAINIDSAKIGMVGASPILNIIVLSSLFYGTLYFIFFKARKISAESNLRSAQEKIANITKIDKQDIDAIQKRFDNDPEIIDLKQKIESLQK